MKKRQLALVALLFALAAWGGLLLVSQARQSAPVGGRTILAVHTSGQATTPQMPLWLALAKGELGFEPDIRYWKNLDDLRGSLLAGQGDIWVGHIDGFAQAALRGAPVRLVCVTGWKKFFFLTSRADIASFEDILRLPAHTEIASAPPHSPAVAVLRALEGAGLPRFNYAQHEAGQLSLKAMRGDADLLLLPEPLVTALLAKMPELRVVASVEEEYGRLTGGEPLLPIAGIAVNTATLARHPGLDRLLEEALRRQEPALLINPEEGLAALPAEFDQFIDPEIVRASLARDVIRVRSAAESEAMIRDYLGMVFPESVGPDGVIALPEGFFGGTR
ncbi:hypothetical protein GKC30_08880 [Pseudodesulfovibrio sp. F-1]|uniref:ABC transporter substrate-binding protein n=1 Tax=Pseudodesulfovibrio alkaliphilus TaxID=2661613 RepID=A0A7K1KNW8_9BACT|nr:hypothetical protein [Pseudodesulfovibrio alkaliphilus]MUM77747.1 hypothetical protein [Pseudodesulfovibrio alkaliphilus]